MNKPFNPPALPFIDLQAQRHRLGAALEEAILKVTRSGAYILGPEVFELEAQLSRFCGAREVVTCANGTDALAMVLMAKGVKPGDGIFCPVLHLPPQPKWLPGSVLPRSSSMSMPKPSISIPQVFTRP